MSDISDTLLEKGYTANQTGVAVSRVLVVKQSTNPFIFEKKGRRVIITISNTYFRSGKENVMIGRRRVRALHRGYK